MAIYRIPVKLDWKGGTGQPGVNIWHVRIGLATDPANDSVLDQVDGPLARLDAFYRTRLPDFGHETVITVGDGVTEVSDPNQPRAVEVTPRTMASTVTDGLPPMLAFVFSWQTTLAARSGKGRTFWGPLTTGAANASDGTPNAAMIADLRTYGNALVADSEAANGWAFGVYGLAQPGNSLSGYVLRDFVGCKVNSKYAVLRSRRD